MPGHKDFSTGKSKASQEPQTYLTLLWDLSVLCSWTCKTLHTTQWDFNNEPLTGNLENVHLCRKAFPAVLDSLASFLTFALTYPLLGESQRVQAQVASLFSSWLVTAWCHLRSTSVPEYCNSFSWTPVILNRDSHVIPSSLQGPAVVWDILHLCPSVMLPWHFPCGWISMQTRVFMCKAVVTASASCSYTPVSNLRTH